jgi:hypothetical protein
LGLTENEWLGPAIFKRKSGDFSYQSVNRDKRFGADWAVSNSGAHWKTSPEIWQAGVKAFSLQVEADFGWG